MKADARDEQRSVHGDKNQRTRRHADHLKGRTTVCRAERSPRYAAGDRKPEVAHLTQRSKRPVELHHQQGRGEPGDEPENEHGR
jgi:hypothetical protein